MTASQGGRNDGVGVCEVRSIFRGINGHVFFTVTHFKKFKHSLDIFVIPYRWLKAPQSETAWELHLFF